MPLECLSGRERSWLQQPFESRDCRPTAVCTMRKSRPSGRLSTTKTQKEAAMATRRSSREEKLETPRGLRRSQRLEMKERPFRSMAYQRPGASIYTDLVTPRTLFRKVLETQPIISPLVPKKPDFPKPVETVQAPLESVPCSNLEIHLSDSAPKATSRILLNTRSKKKVRLSVFERALDEQLASTHSLLDITSQSKSQVSFSTPPPLRSAGKKGLVRRPKNYRGVTVKAFEDGIEQNLLQTKGSQSYLVAPSTLSDDSSAQFADTELFAQPELSRQSGAGLSAVQSQLHSTRQSLARESLPSSIQTPWQGAETDMAVEGVTQNEQKEIVTQYTDSVDEIEAVLEENAANPMEAHQQSLQDTEEGLTPHHQKNMLRQSAEHANGLKVVFQERTVTPERGQQESLHGNSDMEHFLSPGNHLPTNIQNPQSTKAGTPSRRVSRKRSEPFERLPTKEMEDGTSQEKKKLDPETMDDMVSEAEMDSETEEVSEAEMDSENVDLTEKTPAFVRTRVVQCTPLLSDLHAPKVAASRSLSKQLSVKQGKKPAKRACRGKSEPALPSKFVKNVFACYVKMPVARDAFKTVKNCVNLYFKQLSDNLEAYANHARRKTIEPADLELLMRRQGLITDKIPLNVLIERHMPLEYRQLLIPVATSGNKVFPPKR
ncbi:centromere protein T isoform X2 [Zootoca vivipara]|uniref:centromere protein T isoform X2 n=1 Tax=Zootoca vivipara TaxID=8524 RepID=UPI00293BD298|nr:centromere protein T isoform X2 [Zootoca vivipara]